MTSREIVQLRTCSQYIAKRRSEEPTDVVRWMGAVQAQDYLGALWAVGLRTHNATEQTIEPAIADKKIVRTWPMRGTLHFVAPADVRWMLKLLTPPIIRRSATRNRQLHLDDGIFRLCAKLIVKALQGGKSLTRDALYALLEEKHIPCTGQRGIHILWRLAQEGLICFGARDGKKPTFVLLEEWVPPAKAPSREEAMSRLTRRYFASHGPATLQDYAWWSGLSAEDARVCLEMVKSELTPETFEGRTYWLSHDSSAANHRKPVAAFLPPFDEFLVAYKDRSAALDPKSKKQVNSGGGILNPTILIDGRIIGTWKRTIKKDVVVIQTYPFISLNRTQQRAVHDAAKRYGNYLGKSVALVSKS